METTKTVDQAQQLQKDAELKPGALVKNPDDMDAATLAQRIQTFHSNVQEALDEAKRRSSALGAKDQAQQLILEIHQTFKEVDQLQQKSSMSPLTLRKIGDKLDATKPKLDAMQKLWSDAEPHGQDVKGKGIFVRTDFVRVLLADVVNVYFQINF